MRTTCNCPTTKLATFLFKDKRLSQASLELSSSRGLFGSLENKRKRREKRENQTLNENCRLFIENAKITSSPPKLPVTKTMGVYIGEPMCETTRKPNILANTRDKEVINQNEVGWH